MRPWETNGSPDARYIGLEKRNGNNKSMKIPLNKIIETKEK